MRSINFIILVALFSFFFSKALAQKGGKGKLRGKEVVQLGFGGNYAQVNWDGLNNLLDYLNNRPQAGNGPGRFGEFDTDIGPSAALTFYGNANNKKLSRYLVELTYRGRFRNLESDGSITEKIRVQLHSVQLGGGTLLTQSNNFDIGLGLSLDAGMLSSATGTNTAEVTNVDRQFLLGASVYAPIFIGFGEDSRLALGIRPFYQYFFSEGDYQALGLAVFPAMAQEMPDNINNKAHNWGVSFQLVFLLKERWLR